MYATLVVTYLKDTDEGYMEDLSLDCEHYTTGVVVNRQRDYSLTPKDKRTFSKYLKLMREAMGESCSCTLGD